jgi:DNA polymerase delta subunit 1
MPCLAISAAVTSYGRQMIMHTREMVTSRFCKANGFEADCDVIYGDTDSVMVNFRVGGWGWLVESSRVELLARSVARGVAWVARGCG